MLEQPDFKQRKGKVMKLREDCPIYLNPDFNEICEIAKRGWDTIRICVSESNNLLLASGYGNTHNTISTYYKQTSLEAKREFLDCFILYKESGTAYFNTEDIRGGNEKDRRWQRFFDNSHAEIIKDLILESDLIL